MSTVKGNSAGAYPAGLFFKSCDYAIDIDTPDLQEFFPGHRKNVPTIGGDRVDGSFSTTDDAPDFERVVTRPQRCAGNIWHHAGVHLVFKRPDDAAGIEVPN